MTNAQPTTPFLEVLEQAIADGVQITLTGTTGASVTVTAVSSLAGVAIGATITGAHVVNSPPTTIVAMDNSAHTITLSQAATGVGAGEPLVVTNPAPITSMEIGLYTALVNPASPQSILTDCTEPTYTGYARVPVTVGTIRMNANFDLLIPLSSAAFQPTDNVALPQTAIGVFLIGTIAGVVTLLELAPLSPVFVFASSFSGFDLEWELVVPNQKVFGGICSTC